ncbi:MULTISPECIES: MFS transporter [Haloarcula]|uniref:MFS transporter n=1 Tax=Haloarcula pellucida TaxID=1427151 RepID=A0A830GS85_9EURY|nr:MULTISPECIES: MFS transporter [Halomicroarcula]MBX0349558.1 MFS transporter [Halomicroarcula pellucida]MDS0278857.1 MFS transporter [Halomicroarcula sp. S1AR25-4]GGO02362.1 MFS transporter [Halomicroarcula pellucida]
MEDNDRAIVTFTGLAHGLVHTYELSIPIFVVVWLTEFPVTTALLGTVVAVGYGLFGAGALPGGVLADRYGSNLLVTACLVGMGAAFLLLSVAPGVLTIALALGLWGLAASVYHPAGLALISTGVEERGTGFAYHGMAGNAGIALGPLLTALLLLAFDWRVVAALLVVPAVGAVAYALTAEFDETAAVSTDGGEASDGDDGPPASVGEFLADSRALFTTGFALAMLVVTTNGLFYRGTLTFLPDVLGGFLPPVTEFVRVFEPGSPLAEEFDLAFYLYSGLLTVGIAGQYVGGKLTDRIETTTGLAAVFGGLAVVALLFVPAAEAGLAPLLAVSVLLGFLLFTLQPLYQATIAEYSPPGDRGLSYGYTYLTNFGVGAAGAAISGYLLSAVGVSGTFLGLAVFPALGLVFAVTLWRLDA